jgi:hypothetical protein
MGLSRRRDDGRFELTEDGWRRHASDVLGMPTDKSGLSDGERKPVIRRV